jgi:uncharacterized tellurite resistance protein B-like protein
MQEPHSLEDLLDTPQKKLSFYQNLILLAAADGQLEESESSFLINIGNRLGISAQEAMGIAENLDKLSFIIPEEGIQKTLELQTMVLMMLEDGQIHPREQALCREYTRRIGYSQELLDEMITELSGNRAGGQ